MGLEKNKDIIILGLSFGYHDSAACILRNGRLLCAVQEERFTRIKHDKVFPEKSIEFCLKNKGIKLEDINKVVYYENPYKKFNRILLNSLSYSKFKSLLKIVDDWIVNEKFNPINQISKKLNISESRIFFCDHHTSHAASAYFNSGFDNALILTIDGVGEFETSTLCLGEKGDIKKLISSNFPNSIGLFYSTFTSFLGFEVNEGEYKIMGMAGFGKPKYYDDVKKLIFVKKGRIFLKQSFFNFSLNSEKPFTKKFEKIFGKPRNPNSEFGIESDDIATKENNMRFADIASSVQKVTEDIIIEVLKFATSKIKSKNIVLAGGVALNGLANRKIQKVFNDYNLYVYPSPGDSGCAVGCAQYFVSSILKDDILPSNNIFLGNSISKKELDDIKSFYPKNKITTFKSNDLLTDFISKKIFNGNIIGWYQGSEEWGPRALGARSILANPCDKNIQRKVNLVVKYREIFRPFAPSVIIERASEYFDLNNSINQFSPENFMLTVSDVKKKAIKEAPAIVHVDNTARVHTVSKKLNPLFYSLIYKFGEISKTPILLNTSFNLKGEPIVSSVRDAFRTFELSNIDYLVIGKDVFTKTNVFNAN